MGFTRTSYSLTWCHMPSRPSLLHSAFGTRLQIALRLSTVPGRPHLMVSFPRDTPVNSSVHGVWTAPTLSRVSLSLSGYARCAPGAAMTSSRMGPDDIERYFLSADNALLNLLGVHFMMLGPWVSLLCPSIRALI